MPQKRAKKLKKATARKEPVSASRAGSGRLHVYIATSLDGCIATPSTPDDPAGVAWLNPYHDAMGGYGAFIKTIGAVIMGRTTYDISASQPSMFGELPTYVLTHRPLPPGAPAQVTPFAGNVADLARRLRMETRGDVWHMGGGSSIQPFLEQNLIDLWSVAIIPTILGEGPRLFLPATPRVRTLRLAHTKAYKSGVVELRYERA